MSKSKDVLRMAVPSATIFFAGGCAMILELVGSRLVARDLGSSLYTWTSILGVALAGIVVGTYLGGRIADRHHARRALAVLFGLTSAACVGIVVVNNAIGEWMWLWRLSWPAHVFVHVLLVFFTPSVLLGAIAPVVAKMALDCGLPAGRTVGDIYAWGAAGAIAGVFLAGFYLICAFGSMTIIWGIGAAMLAMGILYWLSCWVLYVWAMVFGASLTMGMAPVDWAQNAGTSAWLRQPNDPNVLYEAQTPYCRAAVRQISKRPDRRVFVQDLSVQGETVLGDATNLQYLYARIFAGLTHGLSGDKRDPSMLVIGAGGYAFPRYLQAEWPMARVDVVEVDPGVTAAAMEAFGLDKNTAIRTVNRDARSYVEQLLREHREETPGGRYDFIYEDAIDNYTMPFPLATREFDEKVTRLLTDDGVYMANVIDIDEDGRFLGAMVGTLAEVFPSVYVLAGETGLPSLRHTFVVVATRRQIDPGEILSAYNKHLDVRLLNEAEMDRLRNQAGRIVLTDDFAPVERLLAPVVRQGAVEVLACRYLREAAELQVAHLFEPSIEKYREAARLDPSMTLDACREIGAMLAAQNKFAEAVAAYEEAIEAGKDANGKQTAIARVHMDLGIFLDRIKRPSEAKTHFAKAAEWFRIELVENPGSVVAWERLGDMEAMMGDFKQASDAFQKALALEPENQSHYQKLTRALELQKRYDEAIVVVRKHIKLMQEQGKKDIVMQLNEYVEWLEFQRAKQSR